MNNIIKVDFKNKKIMDSHVEYKWICGYCESKFHYDSRLPVNERSLKLVLLPEDSKKGVKVSLCQQCIKDFHETITNG